MWLPKATRLHQSEAAEQPLYNNCSLRGATQGQKTPTHFGAAVIFEGNLDEHISGISIAIDPKSLSSELRRPDSKRTIFREFLIKFKQRFYDRTRTSHSLWKLTSVC